MSAAEKVKYITKLYRKNAMPEMYVPFLSEIVGHITELEQRLNEI